MRILTEEKLLIELKQKAFNLNIGVRSLEIPTPNPIFAFFFAIVYVSIPPFVALGSIQE